MPDWLLSGWNSITSIPSGWFLWAYWPAGASPWLLCSWRHVSAGHCGGTALIDYRFTTPASAKLDLAENDLQPDPSNDLRRLEDAARRRRLQLQPAGIAWRARRGSADGSRPLLVHAGLVVLMVGLGWGALAGVRLERFLAPWPGAGAVGFPRGTSQLTLALDTS